MLPKPPKRRAAAKPKPSQQTAEPMPDIVLDESAFMAKQRKVLVAPHKHFIRFWRFWMNAGRNERFVIIAALLLLFGAGAIGWFYFSQPKSEPAIEIKKNAKPPAPKTIASPLTGIQVDPALAKRPVTGIMIENSVFARPQSGLQQAGIVYEAIAEGGITRFMALFQEARPQNIGPVRSLRPYFLHFAAPFQASIAHVGGSPEALKEVRSGKYRDIDQFFNANYYWRSSIRAAPHNMYTSFSKLDALNRSKHYRSSLFTGWPRKEEAKPVTPTVKSIDFAISGPDFYVHYDYDIKTSSYLRREGGAPHLNLKSASDQKGVRLHPKVVIAVIMGYRLAADGQHSVYQDTGSGRAYIFQDGLVKNATWLKEGKNSMMTFVDAKGAPVKLNAGQTWITALGSKSMVVYK